MRVLSLITLTLLATVSGGAQALKQEPASGWVTLLDGTTLKGWNTTGNANWKVADGAIEASSGNGMLVSPVSYSNFELTVEFWVDGPANSGVFTKSRMSATATTPRPRYAAAKPTPAETTTAPSVVQRATAR